jgi:hypothetical protein
MEFKLKQEKMRDFLEKMSVQNLFPMSIIKASGDEISSVQREANGVGLREVRFKKSYFDNLKIDKDEVIELDIQRALNVIKKLSGNVNLKFKTKDDKVVITGKRVHINLSFREPKEEDIIDKMPFEDIKDGVPIIKDVELSTEVKMKLLDLKDATDYGNSLGTEFYTFETEDSKLKIRVGDLHKFSDFVLFDTDAEVKSGDKTEAIYTVGLTQIANTFIKDDFTIKFGSEAPALIYEEDDDVYLAILLPPQAKPGA